MPRATVCRWKKKENGPGTAFYEYVSQYSPRKPHPFFFQVSCFAISCQLVCEEEMKLEVGFTEHRKCHKRSLKQDIKSINRDTTAITGELSILLLVGSVKVKYVINIFFLTMFVGGKHNYVNLWVCNWRVRLQKNKKLCVYSK